MDLAIAWAAQEGWNPGLHDAETFYQADPNGFFVAQEGHEVVGTFSVVSYPGDLSFGGLYMVRPDRRGTGVGRLMLDHILAHTRDRNLGIDGVPAMVGTYEHYGFRFAYWNHRFQGLGGGPAPSDLASARDVDLDALLRYDAELFSTPRNEFFRAFLNQPDSSSLVSFDGSRINGFGAVRRCVSGHKVGPLFADDVATARKVLGGLLSAIPGETYFLDVPGPNEEGMALVQERSLKEVFRTARMYTKHLPPIPLRRVFGVTSFELG
jgi:GNAT superfamily N-acetyltransferase